MKKIKKPKGQAKTDDDKHNFIIRLPSSWHMLMSDLRHEKKFGSLQDIYNHAIMHFLQANKKI